MGSGEGTKIREAIDVVGVRMRDQNKRNVRNMGSEELEPDFRPAINEDIDPAGCAKKPSAAISVVAGIWRETHGTSASNFRDPVACSAAQNLKHGRHLPPGRPLFLF
jgi:hypothetical protein